MALMAGTLAPVLWVGLGTALAWAAGEAGQTPPSAPPAPPMEMGFSGALLKMVGGLAGVLAVLLLLYWLVRRFLPGQGIPLRSARMRMLGRLGLGQRSQVAMVQVGDKVLILGVTPNNVNLLDKLDSVEELDTTDPGKPQPSGGFLETLKRVANKEGQGS